MDSQSEAPVRCDVVASLVLFNTPMEEVERAIRQLRAAHARVAIILVDNSPLPLPLGPLRADDVIIIVPGANLGYGRGHNLAIRASSGQSRYHLIMNSDISMAENVIDSLIAFMDGHSDVGLSAPLVRYPDGRIQRLCRLLPDPADLIGRRFFGWTRWAKDRNKVYEFHGWGYDRVASFPFLSGCFMFCRREVLDQVDGFDERYFLYAEDLDLSRRMHGVSETLFVPTVQVVHDYRSEQKRSLRSILYGIRSLSQYFSKWGWLRDPEREDINDRALARLRESEDAYQ